MEKLDVGLAHRDLPDGGLRNEQAVALPLRENHILADKQPLGIDHAIEPGQ